MSVVPLEHAVDEGVFGGKAAQLAAAMRHALNVPPGLALSADTTARIARADEDAVRALEDGLAAFGDERFAVRSSALGEDSITASFAGQHKTCLNVRRDEVCGAVMEVWRSATGQHAVAYRHQVGLESRGAAIGAVVQTLVPADVAGVVFTRDPISGADERVVEASWGLGEAVVAGQVVPDVYRMTRTGVVLERRAGIKDRVVAADETGGTVIRDVEEEAARRLCLDDDDLRQLSALADLCEEVFASPRDIEWAFASDRLWLLQSRPITVGR